MWLQLIFHDDDFEHLHMAFRASRHQMDNGAKHVFVDIADDGANNKDVADDCDGDDDDVTWIQTHLPREITPVMQSTTDR